MRHVSIEERRRRLGVRHHLALPSRSIEAVAEDLVGLHSSDPATVFLSGWARVDGLTVESVEEALYERRSLLRMHGMRMTMFVVPVHLAGLLEAGCAAGYMPAQTRRFCRMLEEVGITDDGEAWIDRVKEKVQKALAGTGPVPAAVLSERVPETATKVETPQGTFGVSTRLLFMLGTDGLVARGRPRGSWIASQYEWALMSQWLDEPWQRWAPDDARVELLRRWLASYGPGTMVDLQWWTGWTKTKVRDALAALDVEEVTLEEGTGFVLAGDGEEPVPETWAALLPGLDPTPMGWKEREWFGGAFPGPHYDRNGNIGPTVWLDGRIVGAWATGPDGDVRIRVDERLSSSASDLVEQKRADLERWLDGTKITPRFRTPIEKELSARTG